MNTKLLVRYQRSHISFLLVTRGHKEVKCNKKDKNEQTKHEALLMMSINGPKSGTPEAKQLIVRSAKKYGERRRYKKTPAV